MNLEIKNLKSGKKYLMYVSHYIARLSRFLDPLCHTKLYHYSFLPNSSASRHHFLCSSKVELTQPKIGCTFKIKIYSFIF